MVRSSRPKSDRSVGYSRVIPLTGVVAIASALGFGIGSFVMAGHVAKLALDYAPWHPYLVLFGLGIPIVLSLAERASMFRGSADGLNPGRLAARPLFGFASGWLLIGGYISLSALLSWSAAHLLIETLEASWPLVVRPLWVSLGLFLITGARSLIGFRNNWRVITFLVALAAVFLIVASLENRLIGVGSAHELPLFTASVKTLDITILLCCTLFGLHYILHGREQTMSPERNVPLGMLLFLFLTSLAGGLAAATAKGGVKFGPSLIPWLYDGLNTTLLPRLPIKFLAGALGIALLLVSLNRAIIGGMRLLDSMVRDGLLPAVRSIKESLSAQHTWRRRFWTIAFPTAGLICLAEVLTTARLCSLAFLWSTAAILLPVVFTRRPQPVVQHGLHLPFHPLFPALAVAICLLLPFSLSGVLWSIGFAWVLLGAAVYLLYGRKHNQQHQRQEQRTLGAKGQAVLETNIPNVMVATPSPAQSKALITHGLKIARERSCQLVVVKVVLMDGGVSRFRQATEAREAWQELRTGLNAITDEGEDQIVPVVRLASSVAEGVVSAVAEMHTELLILDWSQKTQTSELGGNALLNHILNTCRSDVLLVHGTWPDTARRIMVSASGPDAIGAIELARNLVVDTDTELVVNHLRLASSAKDPSEEKEPYLDTVLRGFDDNVPIIRRVTEVDNIEEGLRVAALEADLHVIGVSREGAFATPYVGGTAARVALDSSTPTLMVRSKESISSWWSRKLWKLISDPLPTLSASERKDVIVAMGQAALPSVDFFVLITLASGIASLGLLQNSAAVIIGAMLVAPLMSPILAMAMAMVRGDVRMLLTAAEATSKGIATAIGVGVIIVIISPLDALTPEILGRTEPNLLDLLVALVSGAAAGYGVSRKEVSASMPGVAIAAALVPPLCVVGYGIGTSSFVLAGGAMLLFLTNLVAIVLASAVVFLALGITPGSGARVALARNMKVAFVLLLAVTAVLGTTTFYSVRDLRREIRVESLFRKVVGEELARIHHLNVEEKGDGFVIKASLITVDNEQLSPEEILELESRLSEAVGGKVVLDLTRLVARRSEFDMSHAAEILRLKTLFKEHMSLFPLSIESVDIVDQDGRLTVQARALGFQSKALDSRVLAGIQRELEQTIHMPVTIEITWIAARKIVFDGNPPAKLKVTREAPTKPATEDRQRIDGGV